MTQPHHDPGPGTPATGLPAESSTDSPPETGQTPSESEIVDAAAARLTAYLSSVGLEWDRGARPGEYVVALPGDKKLKTLVSLLVRPRTTSVTAFVIRNPDENHEAFYRALLRKNLRLTGIAYAIDSDGDVYVRGEVPTAALDAEHLDQLFGVVLAASDEAFNELLALGFLGSMKKEWAWRVSRGESTRNLDAFRHLLED